MTTGKTLTRWTFDDKVMSLLFNMLSRLVIAILLKSKRLIKNFMAAGTICSDFGAQKTKASHCSTIYSSICHEVMRSGAMILVF